MQSLLKKQILKVNWQHSLWKEWQSRVSLLPRIVMRGNWRHRENESCVIKLIITFLNTKLWSTRRHHLVIIAVHVIQSSHVYSNITVTYSPILLKFVPNFHPSFQISKFKFSYLQSVSLSIRFPSWSSSLVFPLLIITTSPGPSWNCPQFPSELSRFAVALVRRDG